MRVRGDCVVMRKIMKVTLLLIALAACLTPACVAATNELWFPVGEQLTYRLYWGVIPVGNCEITTRWVDYKGRQVLSIKAVARTTAVVSKIYPVDDSIESLINPVTFLPEQYTQILHEGRHVRNDLLTFDRERGVAVWKSAKSSETNETMEIKIEAGTRDVLCLSYFMRAKGLAVGQTENFRVLVDDKIYDLSVKGLGYEDMEVKDFGKVKCLTVEPMAKFGAIFVRKGRVTLWFSEDSRRICTRMAGKLSVASLKAILTGVGGPGDDAWARQSKARAGK